MASSRDGGPGGTYTAREIEAFRAQVRKANEDARAEIERRGGGRLHPRIQALKDKGLWPPSAGDRAQGKD